MTRYTVTEQSDGTWTVLRDGAVVLRHMRTRAGAEIMAERRAWEEVGGVWDKLRVLDDGSVECTTAEAIAWNC